MPFPNEHACRLASPDDFQSDSFRRKDVGEGGTQITLILAKKPEADTQDTQSMRYDKGRWTAERAAAHCAEQKGTFEPASDAESAEYLQTETLDNVELLGVGRWNASPKPIDVTDEMIDHIVASHNALRANDGVNYDPPLKLGHNEGQKLLQAEGLPSAGWVRNVAKVGHKLVARLEDVPAKVAALIKAGGYKYPSVELLFNYNIGGQTWPVVLKAAAILGADIPAVKNITDLLNLYKVRAGELAGETTLVFYGLAEDEGTDTPPHEVTVEQLLTMLDQIISEGELAIKGKLGAPQIRTYLKEVRGKLRGMVAKGTATAEEIEECKENTTHMDEHLTLVRDLLGMPKEADEAAVVACVGSLHNAAVLSEAKQKKTAAEQAAGLALFCNKILPAQLDWAVGYALSDAPGFTQYMTTVPGVVVDLSEKGDGAADKIKKTETVVLTELEKETGAALGVSEEETLAQKKQMLAEMGELEDGE